MGRRLVAPGIALLVFVVAGRPGLAHATPPAAPSSTGGTPTPPDEAASLKRVGDAAMDALQYDDALDAYGRSYALRPNPALLYNLGRVHQARGEWPDALSNFEQFAQKASPELRARVPKLDELLADARSHVATLRVEANVAGARVLVRDKAVGVTPLAPVAVNAGPAEIDVRADGHDPWQKSVTLQGGTTTVLDAVLAVHLDSAVLRLRSTTVGARISIDERPVGGVPAEAVLAPGAHRVVVDADGFDEHETSIVLASGETKELAVEPERRPPITSRWWFWTGAGAVVAGGVALTIALLTERSAASGAHFAPGQVAGP